MCASVNLTLPSTPLLSIGISSSQNIRLRDTEVNNIDGDGVLMRNSKSVDIDSGPFDE